MRHLVARDGPLDPSRATELVAAAAAGLEAAHAAGLIHRDVKPANVLVGEGRDAGRVYITDFGISRSITGGETMTTTGELIGTADFMAPEQIAGDPVDHRADVYALGAVLYFALTAQAPFPRDNEIATLFAHANAPRPRPSAIAAVSPALDAVVEGAMAVRPDDRFQSAAELGSALVAALGGTSPAPAPSQTAPTKPLRRPQRRRISLLAVGGALAVVAVIALLALFTGNTDKNADDPTGATASVADVLALHTPAKAVAVGEERVWIAAHDANEVLTIDRLRSVPDINLDVPSPKSVAVGFGSVWVLSGADDLLYRLDPKENSELTIDLGEGASPSDVAVDDQSVWVANAGRNEVVRVDPIKNEMNGDVTLGTEPRAIATGDGSVWVTNIDNATVNEIDPDGPQRVGNEIPVDAAPVDIAVGEGGVWVASGQTGSVLRIDPDTHEVTDPIAVGQQPRGIAAGLGFVWVALGGEGAVAQVDPDSSSLLGLISVGENPADLALADDGVWVVTENASGTAERLAPR